MARSRRWIVPLVLVLAATGCLTAAWFWYGHRLGRQIAGYQVGQADSYTAARSEILRFEKASDAETRLHALVSGWGTGNSRFDYYLARYLGDPQCSEDLRRIFSLEFAWRPELLPRWAHYWSWRVGPPPMEEIAAIDDFLATLVRVEPARPLTWREILDLQAIFELMGKRELARRLTPENWPDRYRTWSQMRPEIELSRPDLPFPDWQGPPPKRG